MHEAALAQAALPAPTIIFGLLMRPYSLGHELFLFREGNPLVTGGSANALRSDLAQAVLICSSSFEECRRLNCDWLLGLKLRILRYRTRKLNLESNLKAFADYRETGSLEFPLSEMPETTGQPSRSPGAPLTLRLYEFIHQRWAASDERVWRDPWDYPLGLAKMRWAAYWEGQGGLWIYNWSDAEHDRLVAEEDAKEAEAVKGGS